MKINELLLWYDKNKRTLPWRENKNPYHVWISEVMLQQTRIEAVIPYYERFMKKIPDIATLANISEDELLKLWEGLGYYSRARNLKKAAQMIMNDFQGVFPSTYEEIVKLPGIGEYTASAIASICFQEATPTIDGNVLRVYTRFREDSRNISLDKTKREIRAELAELMPDKAGDFNEALMELGEVICIPSGKPKCAWCPLQGSCLSYLHHSWENYPVKGKKKAKKEVFYTVFLFCFQDKYALHKRTEHGLLKNLWEFPNVVGKMNLKEAKNYLIKQGLEIESIQKSISSKHVFTHQIWYMQAYLVKVLNPMEDYIWAPFEEVKYKYAIPGAFQPFLKEIERFIYANDFVEK